MECASGGQSPAMRDRSVRIVKSIMTAKTKTFDCVRTKRQAQEKLPAEYASRKDEFDCYSQFIECKSRCSAWQEDFRAKVDQARRP